MSSNRKNNYRLLIQKLDQFIRKYYFNKLIKGLLYSVGIIILAFLVISLLEYQFWFTTTTRKILFYGFLGLTGLVVFVGVLIPLFQIFKLGKVISHQQAANIIGQHFSKVKDKLLNILHLKEQSKGLEDASLIEASINQKIDDIRLVPFTGAVNLGKNRKYIKYAALPLLCLFSILFLAPSLIKDSTDRLINNDKESERPAPFHFSVVTDTLEVVQYEDLDIDIKVAGTVLPNEAFIHYNDFPYKLKKKTPADFTYHFNKLQNDVTFHLEANGVRSQSYKVKVIPKPVMLSFDAVLDFPNYLGRKNEVLRNSGDMVIPTGTKVSWKFEAENTNDITLQFGKASKAQATADEEESTFTYRKTFSKDADYTVFLSNDRLKNADSISYSISVIPDQHPNIAARQMKDSLDTRVLYFIGEASDDYGIKSLDFVYYVQRDAPIVGTADSSFYKATEIGQKRVPMERGANDKATNFAYTWDIAKMTLLPGDKLTYYFEVWDNDGVNGSKKARTQTMSYEVPTIEDLDDKADEKTEEFKEDLEEAVDEARDLKEEAKKLQEEILQKKDISWEDKAKIQEMLEKNKDLRDKMEQMQDNYEENMEEQEEFKEFSEDVKEKHEKLQEMLEELMNEELRELFEKLEKLLDDLKKEDALEELENFEMNNEEMEQELDRLMELFKQLEFDQKLEETIEKLEKLAEEQNKLGDETEKKKEGSNMGEQDRKQDKLNEKFEDIKKDLQELDKMGEELQKDEDVSEKTKSDQQQISQDQQQAGDKMKQKSSKSASQKQKSAAQKMQEMAKKLGSMQMQMEMEQIEMDMKAIRQLLENLVNLSFDQEDLMDAVEKSDINTPMYISLMQKQKKLKDDAELIEDSLVALSKRVFQLESFIMNELTEMNRNIGKSITHLADRKVPNANTSQQYVMTSVNNLALMLGEVMQQMQQQMAQQMQGDQMCNKPGSGACNKPGGMGKGKGMGKMQQQLNDQIRMLEQGIKSGKMPGKQISKEAAQLAAKQAALRQALEKLNQQRNKDGKKPLGDLEQLAKDMDQTERDLVNKQITAKTLERQKKILTRLLKAENSEQEREVEKKRKADKPRKKIERKPPPELEEFKKKKKSETELYRTVPPSLRPYYKKLVEKYFKSISF